MQDRRVRGPALNQAIRNYIRRYIVDRGLRPGSPLPPETRLAQDLGVARSSMSEAIRALQALGVIEVRRGDGLYVREYNLDPVLHSVRYGIRFDGTVLLELLQVRVWLETAVMQDAVACMTDEQIAGMERVLAEWEQAVARGVTDVRFLNAQDRRLHQVVYAALDNDILVKLLEVFSEAFADFAETYIDAPRDALEDHQAMLAALKARDAAAARAAIVKNLQLSGRQISSAMTSAPAVERPGRGGDQPLKRPALSEAIAAYVQQYILDSGLGAGDALPSEASLAQELGVGRSSVREAIKALESLGIVEARHGDGLYVREYNFDPILETLSYGLRFDAGTLLKLLQIRNWLETSVIEEVISRMDDGNLARLDAVIEEWGAAIRSGERDPRFHAGQDLEFHRALYAPLGNPTLVRFLEVFWIALAEFVGDYRSEPEIDLQDHVTIVRALKARDRSAAEGAIRANIGRNRDSLLRVSAG